jgi:hypothetical protein
LIVVTGEEIVALPLLVQDELNVTEMGTVAITPPTYISAFTVVVPYAEIAGVPAVRE